MAENNQEFLTAPIDDYLLSIADSLKQAQTRLNQNRILSTDGQSSIVYQIPRLDFELKMTLEIARQATQEGQEKPVIKGAPISNLTSTKRQIAESASTIKGAFVAVPSDGGQPAPIIKTFLRKGASNLYSVIVHARSAAGSDLAGVKVEFNISRDLSKAWSAQDDISFRWFDLENAQATAVVEEGRIKEIQLTKKGKGYSSPPAVIITPNEADTITEEAQAIAIIDETSETISGIEIINGGVGYSNAPSIRFDLQEENNLPKVGASFNKGIIYTDQGGKAENQLTLEGLFPKGSSIVAVIDVLGKTETIVFTP